MTSSAGTDDAPDPGAPASDAPPGSPTTITPNARRAAFAGMAGTFVEYYDYSLYGFLAAVFAPQFFAATDPASATIAALAVFGSGYLARPLGGIAFGHIGDRFGRRTALMATVLTMGVCSVLLGLLPTYAAIGVAAPLLLVLLRLGQGFSAGGELLGSVTFVVESAPRGRRVLLSSLTAVGAGLGLVAGALLAALIGALTTADQMAAWGWRIPFLVALPLALFTLWLRTRLEDSDEFRALAARAEVVRTPFRTLLRTDLRTVLLVMGIYMGVATSAGVVAYVNSYLIGVRGFPTSQVFLLTAVATLVSVPFTPLWGLLSDRFGRRRVLVVGLVGLGLCAYPMMLALEQSPGLLPIALGYSAFLFFNGVASAPGYSMAAELFPARVRYSGAALSSNLATIIASGLTPVVSAALVSATGAGTAPALWMAAISAVAISATLIVREPVAPTSRTSGGVTA